jgi:hypothetical protein
MRFRFMGLPIKRLPYLFAKSYNDEPTSDPARPTADPDQTESEAGGVASVTHKANRSGSDLEQPVMPRECGASSSHRR